MCGFMCVTKDSSQFFTNCYTQYLFTINAAGVHSFVHICIDMRMYTHTHTLMHFKYLHLLFMIKTIKNSQNKNKRKTALTRGSPRSVSAMSWEAKRRKKTKPKSHFVSRKITDIKNMLTFINFNMQTQENLLHEG